jgi:hypothetical protein
MTFAPYDMPILMLRVTKLTFEILCGGASHISVVQHKFEAYKF